MITIKDLRLPGLERQLCLQVELEQVAAKYGYELRSENGKTMFPIYDRDGTLTASLLVWLRPSAAPDTPADRFGLLLPVRGASY